MRNSTKYGAWQQEERQESTFPFQKDSFFTVDLLAGANEVAVSKMNEFFFSMLSILLLLFFGFIKTNSFQSKISNNISDICWQIQ